MILKAKIYLGIAVMALSLGVPVILSGNNVLAVCTDTTQSQIAVGVQDATGTAPSCSGKGIQSTLGNLAHQVVNDLSIVVGIVAVIMIIYGGFRYITSGGESGGVESAKKTLIMAIIGLVIVALAQVIVHIVLNESQNISTSVTGLIRF